MVVSRKKLMFHNRNYAILWWEKHKTAYCESYLIVYLHYVVRITHSTHFVLSLVLHLLCYVRILTYVYKKD